MKTFKYNTVQKLNKFEKILSNFNLILQNNKFVLQKAVDKAKFDKK